MRTISILVHSVAILVSMAVVATASECPGNPQAIGTSRVIAVNPSAHPRIGLAQYAETVPLADHEVVLTFDDGPLPPHTKNVLDALASECAKATFFIVGSKANDSPEFVRRAHQEGHSIGTHTQTHANLAQLPFAKAQWEIDRGITSTRTALGDDTALAPFLRPPYLDLTAREERYLAARGIMVWSIDIDANDSDDGVKITADQLIARVLARLDRKGKGVLLMHDIEPETAKAVPKLLRELKTHGYRIVHVVPAGPGREVSVWPTTPTKGSSHAR